MAKYLVWHPYFGPEEYNSIDYCLVRALEMIREMKGKRMNNVTITREDLPALRGKAPVVARIRGFRID